MIQDLGSSSFHNEYMHILPQKEDFILAFQNREILSFVKQGQLFLPVLASS